MAWYLIQTKPRQERVAQLNLEHQHYPVYLPLQLDKGKHNPLFPRYLFIELNTETDDWRPIRSTRGVQQLVRFGGIPARVPNNLIEYLQSTEAVRQTLEREASFQPGDRVEVTTGLISNYSGIFQETVGKKRALILLDIADQYTTVQIPLSQLKHS